jgi:hypothetical protein
MEGTGRHACTRAVILDTVSPAIWADLDDRDVSRDDARVVSDVSVLCPRPVDEPDNGPVLEAEAVRGIVDVCGVHAGIDETFSSLSVRMR